MVVDRISFSQFADKIRAAILSRTRRYDTAAGPVPLTVIYPVAAVLEDQNNNRLRRVSLLLSLLNGEEFSEADLNAIVFNEGLLRPEGAQATVTLSFRRPTPFLASENGRIQRGFPVATAADESTGQPITFVTTEDRDKTTVVTTIDSDTNQVVYEVNVPAIALIEGETGNVGPERINRPLRPLVGYDRVLNKTAAQGGRDRYSNEELIELYLLAVASRQLSVPEGLEFYVRDNFGDVEDVHEVFGTDSLLTRSSEDAGAVDAFIVGSGTLSQTDAFPFLGVGQTMAVTLPPVVSIDQVVRVTGGIVYEEDVDYEVVLDSSGVGGSTRAVDGIRFLSTASPMPTVGQTINITYTYSQLIRTLQANEADREVHVNGRDLLYRLGERIDIFLDADLTVVSTFTPATVQAAVEEAILDFINGLGLGDNVEASDLQAVVRRISGVDNFVITRLTRDVLDTGTDDIEIEGNEYPRQDVGNLNITTV